MLILILLLVLPTCCDTWWSSVNLGSSYRSLPYPRHGEGRQESEDTTLAVLLGIADTMAVVGRIFEYRIRSSAFLGNISELTVREAGRRNLPSWLFFNDTINTFLGVPTVLDVGSTVIEVTAHGNTHHVAVPFVIDVRPANQLHPAWSHDVAAQPLRLFQIGDTEQRNDITCAWDETVIYTTLIVDTEVDHLSAEERVKLLHQFAHYLSRDVCTISFAAVKKHNTVHGFLHNRVLVAGPGNLGVKGRKTAGAELFWISGCGEFYHSADVAMVMERNIRSGKVTESIGLDVIGWYVWDNRPVARRFRRQIRGTPVATPVIGTPRPTRLPSLTTVIDSTTLQSQTPSVTLQSTKTLAPSSVAYTPPIAILPSSSIAATPSFVMPSLSSSKSPVATSVVMSTSILLSTSILEHSTEYTSTSTTVTSLLTVVTTPLTIATTPLSIRPTYLAIVTTPIATATTPLSAAATQLVGSSTAVPVTSVSRLQILPTRSAEVMTSLAGPISSMPAESTFVQSQQVSGTMTVSSSLRQDATSLQDTLSPPLVPTSTRSSSISVSKSSSILTTPSSAFKPNSTFPFGAEPSSSTSQELVPVFTSASTELPSSEILHDVMATSQFVTSSTRTIQVETTHTEAIPSTEVWTRVTESQSSLPVSSIESVSTESLLQSTADITVMTPIRGTVSLETGTDLLTSDVTAAATTDLHSPTTSLLPSSTSLLVTRSVVLTHSVALTVSHFIPFNSSIYSSIFPHSAAPSGIVISTSSPSASHPAQSTVVPSSVTFSSTAAGITSSPILKSSRVERSSIEVFSSSAAVSAVVTSTAVFSTELIEQSSVEISSFGPTVSTESPGASKGETTIYASMATTQSVPNVTFKLIPSIVSTSLYSEFLSLTSLTFTPFLTTQPLPSTTMMTVTPTFMSSVVSSMFPLETSSNLIVSSPSSLVLTMSAMPVTSRVTTRVTEVTSTSTSPQPPRIVNHIHQIMVRLGTYFEFTIPAETFYDTLDGDTTRLSLNLVTINNSSLPSSSWVQLNAARQVVYGLPLSNDVTEFPSEYVLMASNSHGLTASDVIQLIIDVTVLDDISHQFVLTFHLNYTTFMEAPMENLKVIVKKLGMYYGDVSSLDSYSRNHVSVTDVSAGSVQVSWTNSSVSKTSCENETIKELFAKMSQNGSVSDLFRRFMLPQALVVSAGLNLLGVCRDNRTGPEGDAGGGGVGSTDSIIWLVTIIPAVIVIVLIVVILLIVIIRNKRRSQRGRYLPDSEKPIFGKNRKPILMPEEMEMLDLGLRPQKPVRMPSDNQNYFTNAAYEHDSLPPPPYQQPGSLPRQTVAPPLYDVSGVCREPPPTYRLPPPYAANTNETVVL